MNASKPWLAHYEKGVPATVDVPPKLLQEVLAESVARVPNQTALRLVLKYLPFGLAIASNMSYQELEAASDRFAAALQQIGIGKGDRVAIMLPNIPQLTIAFYGIIKAGAIVVNVNPTYPPPELRHVLEDSGARAIVLLSGLVDRLGPIRANIAIEQTIVTDISATIRWPFKPLVDKQMRASGMMKDLQYGASVQSLEGLIAGAPSRPAPAATTPEDVVLFQYTGGTTGVPKAAMLTHRNLVANCAQMDAWLTRVEFGKENWLLALPAFHVYGMSAGMLLGLMLGARVVMVPDPRNTTHILELINRERISMYVGVPAMYIAIINHPAIARYDVRSVKTCFSGGSALPVEVAQKFEAITGGKLVEGFGMTESSPLALGNPIYGESRPGSIGLPFSSTDAAICALEPDAAGKFRLLGQGEEGELLVKGPQVMAGYWQMPAETATAIDGDGWLHTGDIARMDADGYFYIVDRKKDLIIASGYNVVPREVEEVLFQHPKVSDVTVAGVPHPRRGETVKAYVVLKGNEQVGEAELRDFCKERLAPYKVPTSFEFRTELPRTQAGKVLRRQLVAEEIEKQAASQAP